ncbi:MAG: TM2 domain-containing protein [Deltaproteobacteria bacterium]|nr:TM2 domain-containing protein [Deltaproteobacteria bacterium]
MKDKKIKEDHMFCRNCGNEIRENQEICLKCGVKPLSGGKYCQNCGVDVLPQQEICVKCGVRLAGGANISGRKMINPSTPPKNPIAAGILSVLILGVGHMYLGQVLKGVVLLIGGVILIISTGFLAAPVVWIVYFVDTYMIGEKLHSGKSVWEWEFF